MLRWGLRFSKLLIWIGLIFMLSAPFWVDGRILVELFPIGALIMAIGLGLFVFCYDRAKA